MQETVIEEEHPAGSHFFNFSLQIPPQAAASFYHSGKQVAAKISYVLRGRLIDE